MKNWRSSIVLAVFGMTLLGASPLLADFTVIFNPNPAYLAETSKLAITDPDFTVTGSIGGIGFSPSVQELTVPSTWATWACPPQTEDCTPRVLWTQGSEALTFTLPVGDHALGFEAEPDAFVTSHIIAQFFDGFSLVGTVNYDIGGRAGATLMAADSHSDVFTRVVITDTNPTDGGFAIGDVRFGNPSTITPEPASMLLIGTGLFGVAGALRRKLFR